MSRYRAHIVKGCFTSIVGPNRLAAFAFSARLDQHAYRVAVLADRAPQIVLCRIQQRDSAAVTERVVIRNEREVVHRPR